MFQQIIAFQEGIFPDWEDLRNALGGRWMVSFFYSHYLFVCLLFFTTSLFYSHYSFVCLFVCLLVFTISFFYSHYLFVDWITGWLVFTISCLLVGLLHIINQTTNKRYIYLQIV